MADNQDEPIEIFEDLEDDKPVFSLGKDVSDKDIFQLAKKILIWCAILYIIVATARIFFETKGTIEVWDYTKVVLNSIVSLVLGLYFGSKKK